MKERGARGRHVRGEGVLAQEAYENRFYLLSESAENSYWLKDSQGDKRSRWARKLSIKGNRRLFVNMYVCTIKGSEGLIIKSLTVIIEDQILEVTNSMGLYVAVISKKSWRVQTVFTKKWFDIKCPSAEVETNRRLVESLKSRLRGNILCSKRTWWLALLMESIPSRPGQESWWHEALRASLQGERVTLVLAIGLP